MAGEEGDDPMDSLLSLEEQYYAEGHALGVADGSKAGRVEGRLFGMEQAFKKFAAMGDLAGQCALWEAKLYGSVEAAGPGGTGLETSVSSAKGERLQKHIATLAAMTELASLDTQNSEEAVADFDDRLKRAQAKAKIISSIVGQQTTHDKSSAQHSTTQNMEDFDIPSKLAR